jgi:hypothetical protein
LAPSPLKQAATLVVPTPIWAPVTPDAEAVALQVVVQPLAGTKVAVANAVPGQDEPATKLTVPMGGARLPRPVAVTVAVRSVVPVV